MLCFALKADARRLKMIRNQGVIKTFTSGLQQVKGTSLVDIANQGTVKLFPGASIQLLNTKTTANGCWRATVKTSGYYFLALPKYKCINSYLDVFTENNTRVRFTGTRVYLQPNIIGVEDGEVELKTDQQSFNIKTQEYTYFSGTWSPPVKLTEPIKITVERYSKTDATVEVNFPYTLCPLENCVTPKQSLEVKLDELFFVLSPTGKEQLYKLVYQDRIR